LEYPFNRFSPIATIGNSYLSLYDVVPSISVPTLIISIRTGPKPELRAAILAPIEYINMTFSISSSILP
jgi:hypothetical protein